MKLPSALLAAMIALVPVACVTTAPPRRVAVVEVGVRPPPPRVVVVPAPRRGYVWAGGYWRWNGHRHVWVDGYWMRARPGWTWAPAHWEERRGRWVFVAGVWVRAR